ncbi:MAG: microcin C ABC transporter permease YejB [Neomegalonema sp.]|nr:microcin C ABC transporter permease YejB [Neomegalonema sp.]
MGAYILRRLLLIIPTLLGILLLNFAVLQFLPGGPVEALMAANEGVEGGALSRTAGATGSEAGPAAGADSQYRGSRGMSEKDIAELKKKWGLDKPVHIQFGITVLNYFTFDFGDSFRKQRPVVDLLAERVPVSLTLGGWTFLLSYLISIPLGVRKAVKDGTPFDSWTSGLIIVGYAIPAFLFAVFLLVFFAGGSFLQIFPISHLHSPDADKMNWWEYTLDYLWHIVLPVLAMTIGSFASLTLLTKNSFLDEIRKQYVMTARAKGLTEQRVLYGHVFRNAMLIVIAGFPAAFFAVFTTATVLIEQVFSLDGLGRLGLEAIENRDYPIVLGSLFIFSLIGLISHLITDLTYTLIDPRIDFEGR